MMGLKSRKTVMVMMRILRKFKMRKVNTNGNYGDGW